jgi:hypothetical protein
VPNLGAKPKGEKRLFLADEVAALRDTAQLSLRRPVDRGFVVNTQLQRDIWDRVFKHLLKVRVCHCASLPLGGCSLNTDSDEGLDSLCIEQVNPAGCSLLVTETLFNLPALMARPHCLHTLRDECRL